MKRAHWLDHVLAVPILGIRNNPDFDIALSFSQSAMSIAARNFGGTELTIVSDGLLHQRAQTKQGYAVEITETNIVARYGYPGTTKNRAGRLPETTYPEIVPYSVLLERCSAGLKDAIDQRTKLSPLHVTQIGVMASCSLERNNLPPGIDELVKHLGAKWDGGLTMCQSTLLAELRKEEKHKDRCHHIIKFDKTTDDELIQVSLDWQRVFDDPIVARSTAFLENVEKSQVLALEYFENLAEGVFGYGNRPS